jgi:DNA modification methylase
MNELSEPLTTEHRPIGSLRSHPRNYRRHPERQLAVLRDSLRIHGQQKPVVITSDGTILAGHALVEAAKAEGWSQIAVHVYDGPYPDAFLILDNRANELAENDAEALLDLLREAQQDDLLPAVGYLEQDILALLAEVNAANPKEERYDAEAAMARAEAQGADVVTRVQPGELWALGRHRLLCGDCTVQENWERLMEGQVAHAVVTDPPYAVHYVGGRAAQEERIAKARRGVEKPSDAYWDDMTPEAYRELLISSLSLAYQHSDEKAPLYLWFASAHLHNVLHCMNETGWQERNLIVWAKNNGAGALFAQFKHWYEPLFYAHKQGQAPRWHGPTNERTVWEHDKPARSELHPTMKPLPLIERAIGNATEPGHLVLDPFLGSGTAIIAAERTGRIAFGMDRDARYCSVIVARWEAETGESAVRCD